MGRVQRARHGVGTQEMPGKCSHAGALTSPIPPSSGLPGGAGGRLLDEVAGSSDGGREAADGRQTHLYQL